MSNEFNNLEQVQSLLRLIDAGVLQPEIMQSIHTIIQDDPSARQYYIRQMHLRASLSWSFADDNFHQDVAQIPFRGKNSSPQKLQRKKSKKNKYPLSTKILLSLLFVLLSLALWSSYFIFRQNTFVTVVKVYHAKNIKNQTVTVGEKLKRGEQQRLTQGAVELLFPTGAKVLIAAPATFQVTGGNEILLTYGTLLAEVLTPAGKGFTVITPSSKNVDLGTVFGVAVDEEGVSVTRVFQGKVQSSRTFREGKNLLDSRTITLTSNAAILHRPDGTSTQKIKGTTELFFLTFDKFHSEKSSLSSSNITKKSMVSRLEKLVKIDRSTASLLRKQREQNLPKISKTESLKKSRLQVMAPAQNEIQFWFQGNTGVKTSGNQVTKWEDQSGNNFHLVPMNSHRRPVTTTFGPRKRKGVRFFDTAKGDLLKLKNGSANGNIGTLSIVFIPAENITKNSGRKYLIGLRSHGTVSSSVNESLSLGDSMGVKLNPKNNELITVSSKNSSGSNTRTAMLIDNAFSGTRNELKKGSVYLLTVIYDRDKKSYSISLNGTMVKNFSTANDDTGLTMNTIEIGGFWSTGFFKGSIAEIIGYRKTLNHSERKQLEQYLNNKYR